MLDGRGLILASNRGPVDHVVGPDGRLQARRGSGGVVTALSSLTQYVEFTWIASAMGEGDRRAATAAEGAVRSPVPGQRVYLRYIVTPRRVYHKFYNVFCNPLLWFLQHYMWNTPYSPTIDGAVYDAWRNGYVPVNRSFAQAAAEEAERSGKPCYVMLHDYHLYMTPSLLRELNPDLLISHFSHIPWPTARYWHLLPKEMRIPIVESLCACDIVGFQTNGDVRSFLYTCEDFLDGVEVDRDRGTIAYKGHETVVRHYPISIDVGEMHRIANSPRAREYEQKLLPYCSTGRTIVRVDRAEPSKNIVRGFKAYSLLLEQHPELRGEVNFLAFLVPSRTHLHQYQRYLQEVEGLVHHINETYGTPDWQPVTVFLENNYTQAIAAMRLYDVLLVNPVIDGMNLVSKEGVVVNQRNGVLVLSEAAGSHEQLEEGALSVAPTDVYGTKQALYEAVTMSMEERERRARLLADTVQSADVTDWLMRQLQDMRALTTAAY